jgi:hypothetical protein
MPDITSAMRALEHTLVTAPATGKQAPGSWRSLVANRVQSLRDAYQHEIGCGPASDAFALDAPWICGRLQLLRRDQSRVMAELESLARTCVETVDVDVLRGQVQLALQRIKKLRQRENDLLYESVDLDLGGEQ